MNWFKRIFRRIAFSKVTPPLLGAPKGIDRISIIVGHGNGDPGATCFNSMSEHMYNDLVASLVKEQIKGKEVRIFKRSSTGIAGVGLLASAWGPDLTIELHLNAYNGKAAGCEVLVLHNDNSSAEMAKSFASAFTKKFDRIARGEAGVKWIRPGDRGYGNLKAVALSKYGILVEPFFCDNEAEWIEHVTYSKFLIQWLQEL